MGDIEMSELASQTGSLRRGRSRMDSAYMSTSVSVASDPFSPGLEGVDEDYNGYVLPTDTRNQHRGTRNNLFVLYLISNALYMPFHAIFFSAFLLRFQKLCTS